MYPRFAVLLCPRFLVVHVELLYPVGILYLFDQKCMVVFHGVLLYFLGFATAVLPDVSFSTILMSFSFCAWRLTMDSVRVFPAVTGLSTVSFFWTSSLATLLREATICFPTLFSVTLLSWRLKSPLLVSFWMSRCLLKT